MKPENKFRTWFTEKFKDYLTLKYPTLTYKVQKHADYATQGIPDIDIIIAGMTIWIECKLTPQCVTKRKLDVTELQRQELRHIAQAGAPAGLLVGLPLGPRKGYMAAWFDADAIPLHVTRTDFRPPEIIFDRILAVADHASDVTLASLKGAFLRHPLPTVDWGLLHPDTERVGDHGC